MTTFDKREEGFEKKFALDEELKFKAEARRNKLLGLWVADKLGLSGDASRRPMPAKWSPPSSTDPATSRAQDHRRSRRQGRPRRRGRTPRKMDELMAQAVAQVKAGQ